MASVGAVSGEGRRHLEKLTLQGLVGSGIGYSITETISLVLSGTGSIQPSSDYMNGRR